jgi:hydrogenase maturation protein HypF
MVFRRAIAVEGVVQGVGFRPFVYRLALRLGLTGSVQNRPDGVRIEAQGSAQALESFVQALRGEAPAQAVVERVAAEDRPVVPGERGFAIAASNADAAAKPTIPADLALCAECAAEIAAPGERRYGYPFTNCTNCGPRYSIIESLPYDRPRTSMKSFALCADCEREYRDPLDRRFHAQPVACPRCGPELALVDRSGSRLERGPAALRSAARALADGAIVALKGIGGFQLLCDATRETAVRALRERKRREAKPFAVMFPSLEALAAHASVSRDEALALASPQAPIVLVRRAPGAALPLSREVSPNNPRVGAMLPTSPLHRLLMDAVGRPVVCTSGNLSDEPMCTDLREAMERLGKVADLFLTHDRAIVRPVDDSVGRVGGEGFELLRRARGFAPRPLALGRGGPCVLAFGGQLKGAVAIALGDRAIVSQHLGDLDSPEGAALLERTAEDLLRFFEAEPEVIACDLHPEYTSTRLAEAVAARRSLPLERVQHHHAHAAAVMAEAGLSGKVLGLCWDGTGFGDDGGIWGGEALEVENGGYRRAAHLAPFRLPGGDAAIRDPRRALLGLAHASSSSRLLEAAWALFGHAERLALDSMLERGFNAPLSTSAGRLFDGVSALLGVRTGPGFEGQAAMELEFAAEGEGEPGAYEIPLESRGGGPLIAHWAPMLEELLEDRLRGVPVGLCSARFHNALGELAAAIARRTGAARAVLGGGCFQNDRLARATRSRLRAAGVEVHSPKLFPPNDGAIALGQLAVARARFLTP